MYFAARFTSIRFVWLGLSLINFRRAFSDTSLWSTDGLGDDLGSNLFLSETNDFPLTGQSLDIAATEVHPLDDNLFAENLPTDDFLADVSTTDNLLADDPQVCPQTSRRLRARETSCSNPTAPTKPKFDDRLLTAEEVKNYRCASNPKELPLEFVAVCSKHPGAGPYEEYLASTLSK